MAKNTLKSPFFIDRRNDPRNLTSLTDVKVNEAITLNGVEYPKNTSLESLLDQVVENLAEGTSDATRPYKVYTALITQSGTSAPTATVLENTLGGTPTWAYSSTGTFTLTLTGAFTNNKTTPISEAVTANPAASPSYVRGVRTNANVYTVTTGNGAALANGVLVSFLIEIRVYN